MERHEQIHRTRREIFINNFFGGIAWALGATVGISIIIAIFGFVLSKINLVPFVGTFVAGIINFVIIHNPNLLK